MLSPDQIRVIRKVIDDVAIRLAAALDISLPVAQVFIDAVEHFIGNNAHRGRRYVLALDLAKEGTKQLSWETAASKINAGFWLITVDREFRYVSAVEGGEMKITDSFNRSRANNSFELAVDNGYVYYAIAGIPNEFNLLEPGKAPPSGALRRRRFEDFENLLSDHVRTCVDREQGFDYWADHKKRKLMSPLGGTEWMFQRNLIWWLRQCVMDYTDINSEASGPGEDKTDIKVVTEAGRYLIEIKWLGSNEHNTKYDQKRINEGLAQVKLYLERDTQFLRGYLVIYDARHKEKHEKESGWNTEHVHALCEDPKIIFLESETPSEMATKIAAAVAKEKK